MTQNPQHATFLDVRTPQECKENPVPGAVNIPIDRVLDHIEEIRAFPKPLKIFCEAGVRSGSVVAYLKSIGIECENVGSWRGLVG
jgi:phage shock protein E